MLENVSVPLAYTHLIVQNAGTRCPLPDGRGTLITMGVGCSVFKSSAKAVAGIMNAMRLYIDFLVSVIMRCCWFGNKYKGFNVQNAI